MRSLLILCAAAALASPTAAQSQKDKIGSPAPLAALPPAPSDLKGRPLIMILHGRDLAHVPPERLRREWFTAFARGVERTGFDPHVLRPDTDYVFVHYNDLYKASSLRSCPSFPAEALHDTLEVQLMRLNRKETSKRIDGLRSKLIRALATLRLPPDLPPTFDTFRDDAAWAIAYGLFDRKWVQTVALRVVMHDTRRYFENTKDLRCLTQQRLYRPLLRAGDQGRPVILLTHSMGSLVAYDLFHSLDTLAPYRVARLITFGSQLGTPRLVDRVLDVEKRPLSAPPNVPSWVHIRSRRDPIAPHPIPIRGRVVYRMPPPRDFRQLMVTFDGVDSVLENHSATRYLKHPALARAAVYAWCRAFQVGTEPQACTTYRADAAANRDGAERLRP